MHCGIQDVNIRAKMAQKLKDERNAGMKRDEIKKATVKNAEVPKKAATPDKTAEEKTEEQDKTAEEEAEEQ